MVDGRPNEPASQTAVTKAVVLVAGFGTRLLPAAKAQPKEMLPVGRKPCVQYVVEEMKAAGIREILFVTGRKKTSIEDFFDSDPELERRLAESGNDDLLAEVTWGGEDEVRFYFTRQALQRGTADAVRLDTTKMSVEAAFAESLRIVEARRR